MQGFFLYLTIMAYFKSAEHFANFFNVKNNKALTYHELDVLMCLYDKAMRRNTNIHEVYTWQCKELKSWKVDKQRIYSLMFND